jgi:hypothetical protein
MKSTPSQAPLIVRITKDLHMVEWALLLALLIGFILTILQITSSVLSVSLIGLAVTYFLYAYKPIEEIRIENEKGGFSDLLASAILPKVLWISSSVSVLGLLFYNLNLGNESYKKMFLIGGSTITIATVLLVVLLFMGKRGAKAVLPVLLRAIPLCAIDMYSLLG